MSKNTDAPMAGNIPGMVAPQQSQLPLLSGKTKIDKPRNSANILFNETQYLQTFCEKEQFLVLRKKVTKKEAKEWASPMNIFIRFAEAFASMHVSGSNYLSNKLNCPAKSSHLRLHC